MKDAECLNCGEDVKQSEDLCVTCQRIEDGECPSCDGDLDEHGVCLDCDEAWK